MAAQKLTLKQDRFVTEYLKSGNATEAADKAGYKQTRQSLAVQAYENLRNPKIQEAIAKALVAAEITPEYLMLEYKKVVNNADDPEYYQHKLKALDSLAKIIELTGFKQNTSQQTTITGPITISFGKPESTNSLPSRTIVDID